MRKIIFVPSKANIHIKNSLGFLFNKMLEKDCTEFAKACASNDLSTVKRLYEKYKNFPDKQLELVHNRTTVQKTYYDNKSFTPLHVAVKSNAVEVVKYLIETCDADIKARIVNKKIVYQDCTVRVSKEIHGTK